MPQIASEDRERAPGQLEVDAELVDEISALIDTGQRGMVMNLVADLFPADMSRLLSHLPLDEAKQLFQWLPIEDASEVIAELDSSFRVSLLQQVQPSRLTALLDELDTDDAADVLADLPEDVAQRILPHLEDAADLEELLGYAEDTAGGIMGTEFVAVHEQWTVADATEQVRRNAERIGEIYGVFVIDEEGLLRGIVSLKRILLSPSHVTVGSIMDPDVVSVRTQVDQEEVARIMQRYDLVVLPVVDDEGRLVGRITIDDVVDVIREEAEEDIQLMSGVSGLDHTASVYRASRGRLPWIFMGMAGAAVAGLVIRNFEAALEEALVLASFIPIMMSTAGNVGIQCSAIIVQGLASGELWSGSILRQLFRELRIALVNGLVLSAAVALVVPLLMQADHIWRLALTASSALLSVTVLATIIGTTVPLVLEKLNIDPALATGPFITTSNDVVGLTVYFLLATAIYL